mgnify:CR=1 FL=1
MNEVRLIQDENTLPVQIIILHSYWIQNNIPLDEINSNQNIV